MGDLRLTTIKVAKMCCRRDAWEHEWASKDEMQRCGLGWG